MEYEIGMRLDRLEMFLQEVNIKCNAILDEIHKKDKGSKKPNFRDDDIDVTQRNRNMIQREEEEYEFERE